MPKGYNGGNPVKGESLFVVGNPAYLLDYEPKELLPSPSIKINRFNFVGRQAQGGNAPGTTLEQYRQYKNGTASKEVKDRYFKEGGPQGGGGGGAAGGAILMIDGDLTIENSVFQNLAAVGGKGTRGTWPGAIARPRICDSKKVEYHIKTPEAGSEGGRFSTPLFQTQAPKGGEAGKNGIIDHNMVKGKNKTHDGTDGRNGESANPRQFGFGRRCWKWWGRGCRDQYPWGDDWGSEGTGEKAEKVISSWRTMVKMAVKVIAQRLEPAMERMGRL